MNKTIAYVDGYNLYYGIIDKRNKMPIDTEPFMPDAPWRNLLWCDLERFIISYNLPSTNLVKIKFFEALSHKPESKSRQQIYKNALRSLRTVGDDSFFGGDYKPQVSICPNCGIKKQYHVEKGTDVQLGVEMISDIFQDYCDSAIVLSGDSDLIPVFKKIKQIFPEFLIYVIFPPHRSSKEVKKVVGSHMTRPIKYERLIRYQFPNVLFVDGYEVRKPDEYM